MDVCKSVIPGFVVQFVECEIQWILDCGHEDSLLVFETQYLIAQVSWDYQGNTVIPSG